MFPHHGEAVWRLTPAALCMSCTTLSVLGTPYSRWQWTTSMPARVTSREDGFDYSEHSDGGAPLRLPINDDDGNTIALFQDPARPLE